METNNCFTIAVLAAIKMVTHCHKWNIFQAHQNRFHNQFADKELTTISKISDEIILHGNTVQNLKKLYEDYLKAKEIDFFCYDQPETHGSKEIEYLHHILIYDS